MIKILFLLIKRLKNSLYKINNILDQTNSDDFIQTHRKENRSYLNLGGMGISNITLDSLYFSFVKQVDLSYNALNAIPFALSSLSFLVSLNLEGNYIFSLYLEDLPLSSTLNNLNLNYNRITFIPSSISSLQCLNFFKFNINFN